MGQGQGGALTMGSAGTWAVWLVGRAFRVRTYTCWAGCLFMISIHSIVLFGLIADGQRQNSIGHAVGFICGRVASGDICFICIALSSLTGAAFGAIPSAAVLANWAWGRRHHQHSSTQLHWQWSRLHPSQLLSPRAFQWLRKGWSTAY